MSGTLDERLNKILPRIISDEFLSGSGIGNEIAFYIFDYPPEDELSVRDLPNPKDSALSVSVITPMADGYDLYEKAKALLESTAEGGCVIIRLGNDEGLGRELQTYQQTKKYLVKKNDGTLSESTKRILRDCSEENNSRRDRLTALLGEMMASAEYFVAGQPLKIKASTPSAALSESLEYLVQNTFNKMGYLKHHGWEVRLTGFLGGFCIDEEA